MWTASFRNEKNREFLGQRFFVTEPKTRNIVAVFNTLQERDVWLAQQNQLFGFSNTF